MGFFEQLSDGLGSALVEQIKSKGLIIMLLLLGFVALVYRDNDSREYIVEENRVLKAENKELRMQFAGQILDNQRKMLEMQTQALEYQRMQSYKNERNEK